MSADTTKPTDFDVEQWALGMANLAEAIAGVLRYEAAVLQEAVDRGIDDASQAFAAALDRAHNHGQRST